MKIHDISRALSDRTAVWPGDEPFALEWSLRRSAGETVNLSWFRTSPHVGTHTDAPLHVEDGAPSIDQVDLSPYVGPARVVTGRLSAEGRIGPSSLDGIDVAGAPRLLFRTGTDPDPHRWPGRFASFDPATCRLCAERGAVLVGIDTPSVDDSDSADLPAHHALLAGGLLWLENLDLTGVPDGLYELAALPLKVVGACASPVRAVLIER